MAGQKVSKIEIKKYLREELQCDYGFIIHLTKWGMIQKLQDAYADPVEPDAYAKETLDETIMFAFLLITETILFLDVDNPLEFITV